MVTFVSASADRGPVEPMNPCVGYGLACNHDFCWKSEVVGAPRMPPHLLAAGIFWENVSAWVAPACTSIKLELSLTNVHGNFAATKGG